MISKEGVQVPKILALRMRRHSLLKSAWLWALHACLPPVSSWPLWLLWPISRPLCWTFLVRTRALQRVCCARTPCSHCRLVSLSLSSVVLNNVCLLLHYLKTSLSCMKTRPILIRPLPPCCVCKAWRALSKELTRPGRVVAWWQSGGGVGAWSSAR